MARACVELSLNRPSMIFSSCREHCRDRDLRGCVVAITYVSMRGQHGFHIVPLWLLHCRCPSEKARKATHRVTEDRGAVPVNMPKCFVQGRFSLRPIKRVEHIFPMVVITFSSTCRRSNDDHTQTDSGLDKVFNYVSSHAMPERCDRKWAFIQLRGIVNVACWLLLPTLEAPEAVATSRNGVGPCWRRIANGT